MIKAAGSHANFTVDGCSDEEDRDVIARWRSATNHSLLSSIVVIHIFWGRFI
jgi:hypothetical protein